MVWEKSYSTFLLHAMRDSTGICNLQYTSELEAFHTLLLASPSLTILEFDGLNHDLHCLIYLHRVYNKVILQEGSSTPFRSDKDEMFVKVGL